MTGRRARHGATREPVPGQVDDAAAVYSPSRHDPVARAASAVIGGPAGRRLASRTGFWRALPVLMLLACAVLSLGLVQKQHCRAQGWSSPDQFWHACYSDIPVLYGSASLGATHRSGLVQSLTTLSQPPLAGAAMWITSAFVPSSGPTAPRQFFDLSAVLLALVLALAVAAAALALGRRSWDAAHLALSPVLVTAGLISYELLAVALTAAALLALVRRRPLLGGVLLGLAVVCAPQVCILVVAVVAFNWRFSRRGSGSFTAGALAGWLVVRIILLPGLTGGLGAAFTGWRAAIPGYGSLWLVPQLLHESRPDEAGSRLGRVANELFGWIFTVNDLGAEATSVLTLLLLAALVAAVLRLTVFAPGEAGPLGEAGSPGASAAVPGLISGLAPLGLALLAAVLVTDKSLPIQASLLLLPLIALSGLRWRDHLIWAATELVYFVGIWLYIAGETTPSRGLTAAFYLVLLLARLAGIAWLGACGVLSYRAAPATAGRRPDRGQRRDEPAARGQISSEVTDAGRLLDDRTASAPHHPG